MVGAASRKFEESKDPALLRMFSVTADSMVQSSGHIGSKMTPGTAVIFMLNSLTGLSLLTLPFGFSQAGLLSGSLILFGCMGLSFLTATFMCEALTIANALTYEQAERRVIEDQGIRQNLHNQYHKKPTDALLPSPSFPVPHNDTVSAFVSEVRTSNCQSEFKIRERVELGQMGELVLRDNNAKKLAMGIYLMVVTYTYGTATALVVTVNDSLAHVISSATALYSTTATVDEDVLYRYCVIVSFFIALPLCFANLQKTKSFTMGIMVCRFIAIGFMLLVGGIKAFGRFQDEGASAVMATVPLWRPANFMSVFGNAVFLFGIHHYLPSMISPLEPQRMAPAVIMTAFMSCCCLIVAVCATGMIAFGAEEHATCSVEPGGHFCALQPLYNLNFAPLGWAGGSVGLFVTAYPAMSIASIPIAAITTRNTMARWIGVELSDNPYAPKNVIMTLVVLVPPSVVALITRDVQAVIKYVGGYAGLTVAVLCPLILLIRCRIMLELDDEKKDNQNRPLRSPFGNPCGYTFVIVFYVIALSLVTKKLFFTA